MHPHPTQRDSSHTQAHNANGNGVIVWSGGSSCVADVTRDARHGRRSCVPFWVLEGYPCRLHWCIRVSVCPCVRVSLCDDMHVTDVVVIGAGIAGLSCALRLCRGKRGHSHGFLATTPHDEEEQPRDSLWQRGDRVGSDTPRRDPCLLVLEAKQSPGGRVCSGRFIFRECSTTPRCLCIM